ncbi:MAG: NACHT domain-containing protein [Cyanobacteria bacterium P01_D01_bin.56]
MYTFQKENGYLASLRKEILHEPGLDISTDTISRILDGKRARGRNVEALCIYFGVSWVEACTVTVDRFPDVLDLVQQVRAKVKFTFAYSDRSASNRQQRNWIEKNFIEPDLIEVEFLPSEYPVGDPDALIHSEDSVEDEFDRLRVRLLRGQRTDTTKVLREYHHIFIYGEPGSGKTSYLQWLALNCRAGKILNDYVPIFVEIRQFTTINAAGTLLTYFEDLFKQWGFTASDARRVLEAGKVVFVFDGLDETLNAERDRIEIMIERLLRDYEQCRFIFSSRLARNFPFSSQFQKVIIAPLHPRRHIPEFVQRWFTQPGKQSTMATQMLEKLRSKSYQGIRELSRRPVLLKLLCIVFEVHGDFPTRRGAVFERGIEEMTRPKAELETHITEIPKLQEHHIQGILCRIASYFFVDLKVQILFAKRDVERIIQDYFEEIHDVNRDSVSGQTILNCIEQSNGLLVRWSQDYCAFSHLTYQEFFAASHLIKTSTYTEVYQHLHDSRWNFVTGLTAELLPKEASSSFFEGFKQTIDNYVSQDGKLSELLESLNRAATFSAYSFSADYSHHLQTYIRAWYLVYALQDTGKITNPGELYRHFDLPDFELATSMVTSSVLEGHEYLYKAYHCLCKKESAAKKLHSLIIQLQKFVSDNPQNIEVLDGWLKQLQNEQGQFADVNEWWSTKRAAWLKRVAIFMERLGLPCIYSLNRDQVTKLRTYYDMTKLLSTCMNRSHVDQAQKKQLADSMLLLTTLTPESPGGFDVGSPR